MRAKIICSMHARAGNGYNLGGTTWVQPLNLSPLASIAAWRAPSLSATRHSALVKAYNMRCDVISSHSMQTDCLRFWALNEYHGKQGPVEPFFLSQYFQGTTLCPPAQSSKIRLTQDERTVWLAVGFLVASNPRLAPHGPGTNRAALTF